MVYDEANLVIERVNNRLALEASLRQQAVASILSKNGRKSFTKRLNELNVESRPVQGLFD